MSSHPMAINKKEEKANNFRGTLLKLASYFRLYYSKIVSVLIFSILGTLFSIISPKILGKVTSKIAEGIINKGPNTGGITIDFTYIQNILLIVLFLYLFSALFNYIQAYTMTGIVQKITYRLRKEISSKINTLPLSYFDKHTHGDLLSRLTNDIDTVSTNIGYFLTTLTVSVITLLGILVMMLTISPVMTIVAVLTVPLSGIVINAIIKKSQKHFQNHQKYLGEVNGYIEEMYSAHDVVKAFNGEKKGIKKFNVLSEKLYNSSWKSQFVSGIMMPMINIITNIGYALVCILGGYYAVKKTIQIGDIQAFIQYLRQFNNPIREITGIMSNLQSTVAAAERVFEFLEETEEKSSDLQNIDVDSIRGDVEFNNVYFNYLENRKVIKNFNCTIKAGQNVAIVGPTGAGKTTIVNLLMRFYELDKGTIKIDGLDINNIKREDLRNMLGMVLQDTWLFKGTIKENIAYGKLDASDEEIVEVCKAAHVDDFIHTISDGYNMVIDEEGSNISAGQKQLLTIARCLIANPAILILDEATSSVDTRTEVLIQKAMTNLMNNRTCFIIAHRLSTIRDADLILVMNEGEIIEQGTHDELLNKKGFYMTLYNSQFED